MSMKRDSVFEVSLTEIAFTLIVLLVMILGVRLASSIQEEERFEKVIQEQKRQIRTLKKLYANMNNVCKPDPEDPITPMMPCVKCVSVQGQLSKRQASQVLRLGNSLARIYRERPKETAAMTQRAYQRALQDFAQRIVRGEMPLTKEQENEKLASLADDLKELDRLQKAEKRWSKDLRECEKKTEFYRRRAGLDTPPCWLTADGKSAQYLLNVHLGSEGGVFVTPAWVASRKNDAMKIPGVKSMVQSRRMTLPEFQRYAQQILKASRDSKGQVCRHYVRLKNDIPDRRTADRARLTVENYFYKYEVQ